MVQSLVKAQLVTVLLVSSHTLARSSTKTGVSVTLTDHLEARAISQEAPPETVAVGFVYARAHGSDLCVGVANRIDARLVHARDLREDLLQHGLRPVTTSDLSDLSPGYRLVCV